MAGGTEREDVFAEAARLTWTIDERPNRKGYLKMRCPCGKHQKWLHKTPSNPNYFRDVVSHMRSLQKQGCVPSGRGDEEGGMSRG